MKKTAIVLTAVMIGISGCSSTPKTASEELNGKIADVEFLEKNGPVNLSFDEKGNWTSIKSSATAPLVNNSPEGVEIAFKTATMRAKRNLTEFMSNDVKSTKSVQTISKAYLKNIAQIDSSNETSTSGDEEDGASNSQATKESRQKANTVAQTVRERIDDNSQAILKGVQITNRNVTNHHVAVTLLVTPQSIRGAEQVRKAMGAF